ncbi:MAG TPA: AI-2E family transporter [Armatimonadota bacterium]|jgi:predicted PurR-regulated permease PerM
MATPRWGALFSAVFLGVLAGIAGWFLLVKLYPVIVIALTGFAVAYLLDPVLRNLEARGWKRGQGLALLGVVVLLLLGVVGFVVVPQLVGQVSSIATNWSDYSRQMQSLVESNKDSLYSVLARFMPRDQIAAYLDNLVQQAQAWFQAQLPGVLSWLSAAILRSVGAIGVAFITLLIAFYFMLIIDPFRRRFQALFSARDRDELRSIDRQVSYMLGQYLRGMTLTCLCIALTNALLLQVVDVVYGAKYALLLGVLAGVGYLVPYVGMTVVVLTAGTLTYLTAAPDTVWVATLIAVAVPLGVNQVFDTLVMPRIVGRKIGLHPLVIVLALLAGASLLGLWGMILATPIAATIKIILSHWVPVVATVPEVPAEQQPLTLDFDALLDKTWGAVRAAGHKLEEVVAAPRHDAEAPEEPPAAPAKKARPAPEPDTKPKESPKP